MNHSPGTPVLISKALKIGTLPLYFKKTRWGWAAFLPSKIGKNGEIDEISDVKLCDFSNMTLKRLRFTVANRYLAQVYEDSMECYINLRWALKLPNWSMSPYGAMGEISNAMKRAGLI